MGGIPVLSLPIRLSKRGLSISLELMGPSFSEQQLFQSCRRMRSSSSTFLDFGYWTTSEDIVTKAANRRAGALFAERNFSTSAVPLNAGFQTLSVMQPLCRIRGWCYHHELKLMKNN
ncbi:uncharacterized protein LOC129746706 isoform X2 [Uranotaenia lowii]|uniref:uncharacterized protein LOC129746706 isoform X2 n=1 Tax=Uranotaenia lowii TaxID=190385 RepID=UPI00247AEF7D|nr:uncharacterized protein LOC129746706 isoform X2 [Uranotaenia lowii]